MSTLRFDNPTVSPATRNLVRYGLRYQAFEMTQARRADNAEWPSWLNEAWNRSPDEVGALVRLSPDDVLDPAEPDLLGVTTLNEEQELMVRPVHWGHSVLLTEEGELEVRSPWDMASFFPLEVAPPQGTPNPFADIDWLPDVRRVGDETPSVSVIQMIPSNCPKPRNWPAWLFRALSLPEGTPGRIELLDDCAVFTVARGGITQVIVPGEVLVFDGGTIVVHSADAANELFQLDRPCKRPSELPAPEPLVPEYLLDLTVEAYGNLLTAYYALKADTALTRTGLKNARLENAALRRRISGNVLQRIVRAVLA